MKISNLILAGFTALSLAACSSPSSRNGGNTTVVGDYEVKWSKLPAFQSRVPEGLTPLIFTFTSLRPANQNGVTEEDYVREAAKAGWPPQDYKNVLMGGNAYKKPDGSLASCTILAIRRGLCKGRPTLSLTKRVEMAQQVLSASAKCSWTGFDPAYNRAVGYQLGAGEHTLHVAAEC